MSELTGKEQQVQPDEANVFELAMVLGKALKKDPRMVRMDQARAAYERDEELSGLLAEYEVQQKAMENVAADGTVNQEMVQMIQGRIDTLYKQIAGHPKFLELNEAQEAVNQLMNAVNSTITFAITGQAPSSCTHNCTTCGGCH
jgi:cell fate (sporulation/competence/biofilm development) regulator YlbF (YheA/YmcA/DUF963 family)